MPRKSSVAPVGTSSYYTFEHIEAIRKHPHLLGHIAGFKLLTEVHSQWIRYIWDCNNEFRGLQAHRGSYKSTAVVEIGTIWWLLFHPNERICIIRKTFTDAAEAVATIEKIMRMPEIRELFRFLHEEYPEFRICRKEKLEFTFKKTNTPEGSVEPKGLDAGLTGHHYDRIVCDDITTLKDRISRAERERTKEIFREITTNIIDPGKPVSLIGTPWHKEDVWLSWSGEKPPWKHPCKKYSIYDVSILTEDQIAQKKLETTPSLWAANYELVHVSSDDALFSDPIMGTWMESNTEAPRAHIDAAYGGSDACALTIMARRHDGFIQAIGFLYRGNIKDWMHGIETILRQYRCRKVYVEENSDKGWTRDMLKARGFSVHSYQENMQKQYKISTFLYELWPKLIWDEDTDLNYLSQVEDWTYHSKDQDDAPDSASSLIRYCYSKKMAMNERWKA